MKLVSLLSLATAALSSTAAAIGVSGAAEGFAKGVTGGGSATPVYPRTNAELVSYLGDDQARVIVLTKTFDFRGTEGTSTGTGCAPWGTAAACQVAINANNWCHNYEPKAPSVSVKYDNAGILGILVASDKTLIGEGDAGAIVGKGIRIVSGAKNIIIQNIAITDINPKYVWGGDAITLNDCDMVWIDHVTTARIARQHIVLGTLSSGRVTLSNNFINGESEYSATCDGYHYWGIYLDGSNDMVTMKGNYIYHTSGRSPKVQDNTLLHANVAVIAESPINGQAFTVPSVAAGSACSSYLGRSCLINGFGSSGSFSESDTGFLANFKGKNIAAASSYSKVSTSVPAHAGHGHL
ncbi:hypothetical protein ARAM_005955 [Aspergillus rambellii]|uniref:pectin lyase n=2 Tax=Aspergillus subgen. Nidulantes TaxID=2720870 RepID=A0A0F8X5U0_9EURO|nr:hypothetical protein AOCH_006929 [Aspergillus ochraceoroseus]KKK25010.1 hypothetical protein ARAM_005955 [Aspergillus rambellii]